MRVSFLHGRSSAQVMVKVKFVHACLKFEFNTNIIQNRENRIPWKFSALLYVTFFLWISVFSRNVQTYKILVLQRNLWIRDIYGFLKNLSVIERCPLFRGNLTEIVLFGTNHFVGYLKHFRCLGCPLLGGLLVLLMHILNSKDTLFWHCC